MKVLFIGGTGFISAAASRIAIALGWGSYTVADRILRAYPGATKG
jgi:hypothetical protein